MPSAVAALPFPVRLRARRLSPPRPPPVARRPARRPRPSAGSSAGSARRRPPRPPPSARRPARRPRPSVGSARRPRSSAGSARRRPPRPPRRQRSPPSARQTRQGGSSASPGTPPVSQLSVHPLRRLLAPQGRRQGSSASSGTARSCLRVRCAVPRDVTDFFSVAVRDVCHVCELSLSGQPSAPRSARPDLLRIRSPARAVVSVAAAYPLFITCKPGFLVPSRQSFSDPLFFCPFPALQYDVQCYCCQYCA
jgi:hypothetical protein